MLERNKIYCGDCLELTKEIDDNSVDAIITDPPYELGFMNKHWDNSGIAYNVDLWKQCLRVLKPGGYLLSFGGTRTYHRMACAIEDAGFEIRDMVEWIYGSGFPKSLNIGKAVDKLQGNNREFISNNDNSRTNLPDKDIYWAGLRGKECSITKGNSQWEGWGTNLKPAHEPICMARKKISKKTVAENVLKWGTGGINIDECRVELKKDDPNNRSGKKVVNKNTKSYMGRRTVKRGAFTQGRFPANLAHDGSDEVMAVFPNHKSTGNRNGKITNSSARSWKNSSIDGISRIDYNDNGSAARFFYCAKASKSEKDTGCEELERKTGGSMCANTGEVMALGGASLKGKHKQIQPVKNNHPTVKPIKLMKYLVKLVTTKDAVVLDPFCGSGSTLIACKKLGREFIGIEQEPEYCEIANKRLKHVQQEMFV